MRRLLGRGAVWLLAIEVCAQPLCAQTHGVGCDGSVVWKAGRSGPCTPLAQTIAGLLKDPAVARDHWGIAVVAMDGAPIYSLNDGQLFQPASNAKLFTTAAAMDLLGGSTTFETKIIARGLFGGTETLTGDLLLVGAGDANLSGREIPYVAPKDKPKIEPGVAAAPQGNSLRYLETMADQVSATGLKVVNGDVVGDGTLFPWEPYAQDWAIDDAVWGYGAPVSALTINDNQIKVTVAPAAIVGEPATVALDPIVPSYYTLEVSVTTGAKKSGTHVQMERALGSKALRVYGAIAMDAQPDEEEVAILDPAEYAAMALKGMLEARGIVVTGAARASHVPSTTASGFLEIARQPLAAESALEHQEETHVAGGCSDCVRHQPYVERVMGSHFSAPLVEDVVVTNKMSQNLHAELMLHQLGLTRGLDGSTAQGVRVVTQFLLDAGIDKDDFVLFDGSGLSGHDLVTPRATVRLLQYASGQTWFADWKRSLPVGGVDGSLEARFTTAPLKGKVFAKTGTLGEARALSGYVECASGRTVIFSMMSGNHPPQTSADREVMDRIVAAIAAAN